VCALIRAQPDLVYPLLRVPPMPNERLVNDIIGDLLFTYVCVCAQFLSKFAHGYVLDAAIAFAPMRLPAYGESTRMSSR
jgi:hypothetical protein